MLPAVHRLRSAADFRHAVRRGRRAGGDLIVVHHVGETGTEPARIGFVVSRAVGNAVSRNLVKRRLRHLVLNRLDAFSSGSVTVVRAQPAAAGASYAALGSELDAALRRLSLRGD